MMQWLRLPWFLYAAVKLPYSYSTLCICLYKTHGLDSKKSIVWKRIEFYDESHLGWWLCFI